MKLIETILTPEFYTILFESVGSPLQEIYSDFVSNFSIVSNIRAGKLEVNSVVDVLEQNDLANTIAVYYRDNWKRMYAALSAQYNPIHNYNMTESSENYTEKSGETENYDNLTNSKTGNEKIVNATGENLSSGMTVNNISVDENGVSWNMQSATEVKNSNYTTTYNNSTGNLSEYNTQQGQSSSIRTNQDLHIYDIDETKNGQLKHSYDDLGIEIQSPITNTNLKPNEFSGNELNRSGNIGVTTTQKMIESEMQLRMKYYMMDIIVNNCIDFCSGGVWK